MPYKAGLLGSGSEIGGGMIDPALVSAPLITTLVAATGLVIYMLIAKSLLSALRQ